MIAIKNNQFYLSNKRIARQMMMMMYVQVSVRNDFLQHSDFSQVEVWNDFISRYAL